MTGAIVVLPPETFGVDYAGARPSVEQLRALDADWSSPWGLWTAHGARFANRYICAGTNLDGVRFGTTSTTTFTKIATKSELQRLADGGIASMLHYEQDEAMMLAGAAGGHRHGKVAAQWIDYFDYPRGLPMLFSCDINVSADQFPVARDFLFAAREELAAVGTSQVGCYGKTQLLRYLDQFGLCDLGWKPMATSWSDARWESVDVFQWERYIPTGGGTYACDGDWLIRPTPFWALNGEPDLPVQEEPDMTDDERAMLYAIKTATDQLLAVNVPAVDANGAPVFTDPFGQPFMMSWGDGWPWDYIKNFRSGLTPADIGAIASAVAAAVGADADVLAIARAVVDELHRRTA